MERLAQQFGIGASDTGDFRSRILSLLKDGCRQGVIRADEEEMIRNVFELSDQVAQDVMTHRRNIVGLDNQMSLKDALDFMLNESHSRFPVYEENVDNITGILFLKDAMKCMTRSGYGSWKLCDIPGLLREAKFIPETRDLNSLFKTMQSQKLQMVIVADEYGQTAGLVAMEDILEVIVGNIQDEYDNDEPLIVKMQSGDYLISGMAQLNDVAEELEIEFEDTEAETLNGFLISRLDKIPDDNDRSQIDFEGYRFQILKAANKMIEKVKVHRLPQEEPDVKIQD